MKVHDTYMAELREDLDFTHDEAPAMGHTTKFLAPVFALHVGKRALG